jgi:hypothetical protein
MTMVPKIVPQKKERSNRKRNLLAALGLNSFAVSVLIHVFLGVIAAYLIVEHFQGRHHNFEAAPPVNQAKEIEHKMEVAKKRDPGGAPPDLKRITSTAISDITLPDVPVVPDVDDVSPSPISGLGGLGMGTGTGNGNGSGDGSGYGSDEPDDTGFLGNIYDLKQTADHQPTEAAENAVEASSGGTADPNFENSAPTKAGMRILGSFLSDWDMGTMDQYYKSPATLSNYQICIPVTLSENAPKAYHVEGIIHPRRWVAIYHAKITPPTSGTYRFIGFADDFMVVRIDDENVLDATFNDPAENLHLGCNVNEDVGIGPENQPYKCGKWIPMQANITMDMQVLIGEGPGGASGFLLLIQKQGDNDAKGDYPVFQLKDVPIPDMGPGIIPSKKKIVFQGSQ